MTARLDPRIAELAGECGRRVSAHDGGFAISGSDVRLVVRDTAGVMTVEAFERGASNGVQLATGDDGVLQRFLVTRLMNVWRSRHGLGLLPTSGDRDAPGYEVIEDEDESARRNQIRRSSDGTAVARGMLGIDAESLVVTLPYPLDDVLAAVRDRAGAPVWGKSRRWLRR